MLHANNVGTWDRALMAVSGVSGEGIEGCK
jgi:hypothetical protein